jgi:endonuclease-3
MGKIQRVCDLLEAAYGKSKWKRHNPPLDELILTILSQNTTAGNCRRAFANLRAAFPRWEDVMTAPVEGITESIRVGGLAGVKAARIQTILWRIYESSGALDLDWLEDLPMCKAEEYLLSFEGVGPKTAACLLLFSFGKPALPVDTHVHRVSRRVGLIPEEVNAGAAHQLLRRIVPERGMYSFHLNAIRLGRKICRPRNPRHEVCPLYQECDFARKQTGAT